MRSLTGGHTLLGHDTLHVLHHHDSVVHHDTDRQDQSQQGKHIQREAEDQHETERSDQGDRDSDRRDQGRTPILQREEHHENDQEEGLEQGLIHLMHGLGDILRHIKREIILQALREVLADILHRLFHLRGDLQSVRSRQHIDTQDSGVLPVDPTLRRIRGSLQRYPGHVAHPDDRAIRVRPHHDILKLLHGGQTSRGRDRQGDIHVQHRLLTQLARRRFPVLVFQGILQVLYRQSHISQPIRIYPDLHTVITATDIRYTAYARDTAQYVQHVDRGEVTQINLVELRIVGHQAQGHQLAGCLLLDRDTILDHLGGQTTLGQFHTVLDLDSRQVRIGGYIEGHRNIQATRVRATTLHINHAGRTVQLLLDWGSDRLRHCQGARSRIRGADLHHGGRNLRILVHRQQCQSDDSDNHDQDR